MSICGIWSNFTDHAVCLTPQQALPKLVQAVARTAQLTMFVRDAQLLNVTENDSGAAAAAAAENTTNHLQKLYLPVSLDGNAAFVPMESLEEDGNSSSAEQGASSSSAVVVPCSAR